MPEASGWATALRVARLTLAASLAAFCLNFLASWLGVPPELGLLLAIVISGWIALSALACLLLQLAVVVKSRGGRRSSAGGHARAE